jgi:hypothetical protein
MTENEKYQKIDLQAVLDTILPVFRPSTKVAVMQRSNGIYLLTDDFAMDTDQVIAISLALYGVHNALRISSFCIYDGLKGYHLALEGGVYKILPKFYDGNTLVEKKAFILKDEPNE